MKGCSLQLITEEIQIKTTMRHPLTSTEKATIKTHNKLKITLDEDVEKMDPLFIAGENVKWCSTMDNRMVVLQKINRIQQLYFWVYTQNLEIRVSKTHPCL